MENSLSAWFHWSERNKYSGIRHPGIYIIAISKSNLTGKKFSFRNEIVYVGMTNSLAGLQGRITQFDNTIAAKRLQHGGADRFRYKHRKYSALVKQLFVAYRHFPLSRTGDEPAMLRVMGKVANAEYECLARCVEEMGYLPEFNRKKDSRKFSKSE